ncbi:MAG TPA: hypothetical protein PLP39_00640 [Flavobacterium lutivivi]|nr:hypothetical protein [Flavobacterium lutivivi]
MIEELKEKFEDFVILLVTILLDALLVVFVGVIIYSVKYILENWVFHVKIESMDNKSFITIYTISKIFLVVAFLLYIFWDIISQIIKIWKRIRK